MISDNNIVIIDPEPYVRDLLGEYLGELGYRVFEVSSLSEGLDIISDRVVSVVLMDVGRATIREMESIDRIKATRPGVRIILLSGNPTLDGAVSALRHGVFDFVIKPFRLEDLKDSISRAFEPSSRNSKVEELQIRIMVLKDLLKEHGIKLPDENTADKSIPKS
jgi:DNA-binding NtrC family response regulator